jgi:hypothetical protein
LEVVTQGFGAADKAAASAIKEMGDARVAANAGKGKLLIVVGDGA